MATLDFPSSPVGGQKYTLNGVSYYYDATVGAWLTTVVQDPIITSVAHVGSTPPTLANTQPGDIWFNTDLLRMFVYFNDGTSSQWVEPAYSTAFPQYNLLNVAFNTANVGYSVANGSYVVANGGYTVANASFSVANASFGVANAGYTFANGVSTNTTAAFTFANGVSTNTTAAFAKANAAVSNSVTQTYTATQTFNGSTTTIATILKNAGEPVTITGTGATGTINFDVLTQSVLYYNSSAGANWTVNLRGSSGTSMDSLMTTGQAITVAFLAAQGGTAYYNNSVTIDSGSPTVIWQGGSAPSGGNASSTDIYTYTIIKTGSATFTVLASQTQFK